MPGEQGGTANLHRGLRDPAVANVRQGAQHRDTHICLLGALHLLDRVALNHVTNLVPERSRQLVESIRALDESSIYVDVSARKGEGVDLLGVYDIEVPVQIGPAGGLRYRLAEGLDVAADGGIGDNGQLRVYFSRILLPHGDFLVL